MEPLYFLDIISRSVEGGITEFSDLTLGEALDIIEEHADGTNEFGLSPQ